MDFEDKFAPNGQIYHDFWEIYQFLAKFLGFRAIFVGFSQIIFQFDVGGP